MFFCQAAALWPVQTANNRIMKYTLEDLAAMFDGVAAGNVKKEITGVAPFDRAGADHITLAGSRKFLKRLEHTAAGAVIVPADFRDASKNLLAAGNPEAVFTKIMKLFTPVPTREPGISAGARIGKNFRCGEHVCLSPGVIVGDDVVLGSRVMLHPGVVLGDSVRLGDDVEIHPNVSILRACIIGNRVIIHAGTVIGSDGFGYAAEANHHIKRPHFGIVQIDDDVEIGANNAIDRGTFDKTWIKQGVKTDNLVHIAHNVTIGENTLIVAQAGIAGSVTIGSNVILAGQSGISQHLAVGNNAIVGPQAGIVKSVKDGEIVSGTPGMPHRLWLKVQRILPRLPEIKQSIKKIDKRLAALESQRETQRHGTH